ncbi:acetate/propionate family kinase [Gellertiella hungarica]|uniref:Acetate kinase n=1 Tax=Gellertiella hungarica TaxID=1572859 RepID=A0A7W6J3B2_9HYPH|nr:acetate/propionate family kinase [Gellertiella hungarica]MBB4063958.1 acetate kinase [Gellertiella hungarica]
MPTDNPATHAPTGGAVYLAVNSGSSSVKVALFDDDLRRFAEAEASRINTAEPVQLRFSGFPARDEESLPAGSTHADAIDHLAEAVSTLAGARLAGIGHRVVHGGESLSEPRRIDDRLMAEMEALSVLAPLHQPHNLSGIRLMGARFANLPQVACFDTGFHRTIPEKRQRYGLPPAYAQRGLRAFGFHGLSCTHVVDRFEAVTGNPLPRRLAIAHLGNGASVTGVVDGRSVYNSMGFTPIDGLIMGQRSGHLDPGAVLWLVDDMKGDTAAVSALLNRKSGLLGLSGESSDMRTLLASTRPDAALALDMFVDRVAREVAVATAAAGGIDALVFTGGIGSGAALIRERVMAELLWLGLRPDGAANRSNSAARLTEAGSPVSAWRIVADEERVLCRAVKALGAQAA